MSQSSVNRLSVTRNFVEKHGEVEQVYRKLSKQSLSDETVLVHDLSPKSKVTPQQLHPEHTPEKIAPKVPTIDVEDEISEIKVGTELEWNFLWHSLIENCSNIQNWILKEIAMLMETKINELTELLLMKYFDTDILHFQL